MRINKLSLIDKFVKNHPRAKQPLQQWKQITEKASWSKFDDVLETFSKARYAKGFVIFNIRQNEFRLISKMLYRAKQVIIHRVFTHKEYDRWDP